MCIDGVLNGSYAYKSCVVSSPKDCELSGKSIQHGQSLNAYFTQSVASGEECQVQVRECEDGTLSGNINYFHTECEVTEKTEEEKPATAEESLEASCQFNGQVVSNGSTVEAYQTSTVPFGGACSKEVRSCTNGVLSGTYEKTSCAVEAGLSCTFNGQEVSNGSTVEAYLTSTVPFGGACSKEVRSCTNGVLSGTYEKTSCSVEAGLSCTFNGQEVSNGSTVEAYLTSTVPLAVPAVRRYGVARTEF